MKHTLVQKRIISMPVSKLQSHPRQAQMFPELTDAQFEALVANIRENGLINPIEILPSGVVISGHQRLRAVKRLGWTHVHCWVRDDLDGDDAAVERRFIEDNAMRRQLSPLGEARCYLRLKELGTTISDGTDLRDFLALKFGRSGRTLDRWARVLDTPLEVQALVEAGKVPLVVGGRVAELGEETQRELVDQLREADDPRKVVESFVGGLNKSEVGIYTLFKRSKANLRMLVDLLELRTEEISWPDKEMIAIIEEVRPVLDSIEQQLRINASEYENN